MRFREHNHAWLTESAHTTSQGTLLYVRCALCGARRVDLQRVPREAPSGISKTVPGR